MQDTATTESISQTPQQREALLLAPYAMHSGESAGRKYPEPAHPYRSLYQRDRDRILHSSAYRRLSGKTQVFTGDMGDYHRTRLTHTMEVASIARTLGRALRLNEDLIEALALLHDIGHPPFGHAGEDALRALLSAEGGFSHNEFALTIVEQLEQRYPEFPGLNLTYEVLEGQRYRACQRNSPPALLEIQVVDAADSITYNAHDVDDALKLGWVSLEKLQELPLVADCTARARDRSPGIPVGQLRSSIVHQMIDSQVNDLLLTTAPSLSAALQGADPAAAGRQIILAPSRTMQSKKEELERFLYAQVYRHPDLVHVRRAAQEQITQLWHALVRHPHLIPEPFRQRAERIGLPRAAADFIAGMTDRYCQQQHQTLQSGQMI